MAIVAAGTVAALFVAVMCGLVESPEDAKTKSPYVPFFDIVSPPADSKTISGKTQRYRLRQLAEDPSAQLALIA